MTIHLNLDKVLENINLIISVHREIGLEMGLR